MENCMENYKHKFLLLILSMNKRFKDFRNCRQPKLIENNIKKIQNHFNYKPRNRREREKN